MVMFRTLDLGAIAQRLAQSRSSASMEQIVRPFVTIDAAPPAPPAPRQPLPGEDDEAFIEWGGPSRFVRPDISDPVTSPTRIGGVGFKAEWPKDKENEKNDVLEYREVKRTTETIRVENPDDENQYVMVERIQTIDFAGSGGKTIRLTLDW